MIEEERERKKKEKKEETIIESFILSLLSKVAEAAVEAAIYSIFGDQAQQVNIEDCFLDELDEWDYD